ncbi:FliM/FliN family flagellar motor switch protein [Candidatus Saganbacteria bacterium]|nr:FliM/FliN family flagellar motor switch protein [Candidatus Saganbacteria bacterium]
MTTEKQTGKPEIGAQKRVIKLAPALGDWTTYKPPRILVKKVKSGLYGFDRLSKKELTLALTIHYRFIQQLLKRFKADLDLAVELSQTQMEQTTYLSFFRPLTGSFVQCRLNVPDFSEPIFFFLEQSNANAIINYALGSIDLEPINRALTEAEKITLTTALNEYLPLLNEAFNQTLNGVNLNIISSPDVIMDPTVSHTSTLAAFSADISLADNPPAKLIIAYPGYTLKKLLAAHQETEDNKSLDFSRLPAKLQAAITVSVSAILGETTLTATELQQFEVGDVVTLEADTSEPITATVGEDFKLFCQPGLKNKKLAARVVGLQETTDIELPPPLPPEPLPQPPAEQEAAANPTTEMPAAEMPEPNPETEEEQFEDKFDENFDEDILDEDFLTEEQTAEIPEDKQPGSAL